MQEDHVSMGWAAGMKLRAAVDGLRRVLAIEILVAARGLDLRAPLRPAAATDAARTAVRGSVSGPGPDEWVSAQIEAVVGMLEDRSILDAVDRAVEATTSEEVRTNDT
jgi:histidine ammonia-lyase